MTEFKIREVNTAQSLGLKDMRHPAGARNAAGKAIGGTYDTGSSARNQIQALNRHAATVFQAHLVETLRDTHWERPAVTTGRLTRAMANSRNRASDENSWRVGDTTYLDNSIAKYWRLIDQGSAGLYRKGRGFIGMKIYGKWSDNDPVGRQGTLRGMTKRQAKSLGKKPWIVKVEIAPHRYFDTAIETYRPVEMWSADVKGILTGAVRAQLRKKK